MWGGAQEIAKLGAELRTSAGRWQGYDYSEFQWRSEITGVEPKDGRRVAARVRRWKEWMRMPLARPLHSNPDQASSCVASMPEAATASGGDGWRGRIGWSTVAVLI